MARRRQVEEGHELDPPPCRQPLLLDERERVQVGLLRQLLRRVLGERGAAARLVAEALLVVLGVRAAGKVLRRRLAPQRHAARRVGGAPRREEPERLAEHPPHRRLRVVVEAVVEDRDVDVVERLPHGIGLQIADARAHERRAVGQRRRAVVEPRPRRERALWTRRPRPVAAHPDDGRRRDAVADERAARGGAQLDLDRVSMDPDRPIGQQAHHLPETARPRPLRRAVDQRLVGRPVAVGPARAARRRVAPTVEGAVEEQRRDARRRGRRLVAEHGARHQTLARKPRVLRVPPSLLGLALRASARRVGAPRVVGHRGRCEPCILQEPRHHRASRPRVAERLGKVGSMVRAKVT